MWAGVYRFIKMLNEKLDKYPNEGKSVVLVSTGTCILLLSYGMYPPPLIWHVSSSSHQGKSVVLVSTGIRMMEGVPVIVGLFSLNTRSLFPQY